MLREPAVVTWREEAEKVCGIGAVDGIGALLSILMGLGFVSSRLAYCGYGGGGRESGGRGTHTLSEFRKPAAKRRNAHIRDRLAAVAWLGTFFLFASAAAEETSMLK